MMKYLLTLTLILFFATALRAQQNRYVSQSGSDGGNACDNSASPCLTINHAMAEAAATDTLNLAAGTYTESMTITKRITIRGEGPDATIIQAHEEQGEAGGRVVNVRPAAQLVIIEGVTIRHGNATGFTDSGWGGGIFVENAGLRVSSSRITDNIASRGGGIYVLSSSPRLVNVEILRNEATQSGQGGGGMYITASTSAPVLINTVIFGNKGQYGGGIHLTNDSRPELINVSISGNEAEYGGGLYVWLGAMASLTNSIVWGNDADELGNEFYNANSGSAVLAHSIYRDGEDNINEGGGFDTTESNLTIDPIFLNSAAGNLRLAMGSPAIDAGTNAPFEEGGLAIGVLTDADGNDRIFGGTVDIGAYEFDGTASSTERMPEVPAGVVLHQNYPNPFNPSTVIRYELAEGAHVRLEILTLTGQSIELVYAGFKPAGVYTFQFDATGIASGVYFYRLTANGFTSTRSMMLLK